MAADERKLHARSSAAFFAFFALSPFCLPLN